MSLIYSMKRFLLALIALLTVPVAFANEGKENHEEEAFNVGKMITEHVTDAHEWHLWGDHHNAVSVYLPIILIDNGLQLFSSKSFYHSEAKVAYEKDSVSEHYFVDESGKYGLFKETIYHTKDGGLQFNEKGECTNTTPLDFSITKNTLSLFFGAIIILFLMMTTARYYKKNGAVAPKGLAKFMEPMILMVRDIALENIGEKKYKKYIPYLATIFFFIWINNMLGIVPIIPGGANLTGSLSVTFILAIFTLLATLFSANKNYWGHIFMPPGVPIALLPIMIPIEIIGIFTKPFALMIRLFANMTAGHVIILALISIIFINESLAWGGLSVPMALFISILEILVAFLQGYLFCLLSALFIGNSVEEAHH
ncbi:MAG: ATP synthase F0 subunit A [Candidatus Fluviicola riflensis]|nr:MAG: ATP synthase F0 subunit A [Candidatus Fluviicola riflensis]OGS77907.1 MAG: ATP synthase F0 subunit A [Candidatus Fluviicola riflensis]OGS84972.1 MAG: ATP synthase F0 subunit A [Fluviicola sp. RIFCSPHIGHO2_01_FULL_43_53]OGS89244.1 MAG: ATP synthase F0 subunit A [Fluviicola sp. RIFCSPHIGHO2_12_FULL_43_24]